MPIHFKRHPKPGQKGVIIVSEGPLNSSDSDFGFPSPSKMARMMEGLDSPEGGFGGSGRNGTMSWLQKQRQISNAASASAQLVKFGKSDNPQQEQERQEIFVYIVAQVINNTAVGTASYQSAKLTTPLRFMKVLPKGSTVADVRQVLGQKVVSSINSSSIKSLIVKDENGYDLEDDMQLYQLSNNGKINLIFVQNAWELAKSQRRKLQQYIKSRRERERQRREQREKRKLEFNVDTKKGKQGQGVGQEAFASIGQTQSQFDGDFLDKLAEKQKLQRNETGEPGNKSKFLDLLNAEELIISDKLPESQAQNQKQIRDGKKQKTNEIEKPLSKL